MKASRYPGVTDNSIDRISLRNVGLVPGGRSEARAKQSPARVVVAWADAMRLPFEDGVFDGLVCNLALCTIPDPAMALSEVARVLKPGSPAHFMEHVRARNSLQARGQDLLAPLWARIAAGCRLNQDTEAVIRASGLGIVRVEEHAGLILPMKLIWAHS